MTRGERDDCPLHSLRQLGSFCVPHRVPKDINGLLCLVASAVMKLLWVHVREMWDGAKSTLICTYMIQLGCSQRHRRLPIMMGSGVETGISTVYMTSSGLIGDNIQKVYMYRSVGAPCTDLTGREVKL